MKTKLNEETITVGCYVDQLINNDDGVNDNFGSAYLIIPKWWAEKQAIKQGYETLEDFCDGYTYDDTMGWIDLASKQGVLMGTGTGDEYDTKQQDELNELTTIADRLHCDFEERDISEMGYDEVAKFINGLVDYLEKTGGRVNGVEYKGNSTKRK